MSEVQIDPAQVLDSATDDNNMVSMNEQGLVPDDDNSNSYSPERTICSSTSSSSDSQQIHNKVKPDTWKEKWSAFIIKRIHVPLLRGIQCLAWISARNPIITIAGITFISFLLLVIGLFTNFTIVTAEDVLYTPNKSFVVEYKNWIDNEAKFGSSNARRNLGFVPTPRNLASGPTRYFIVMVHGNGKNMLGREAARLVFNVSDTMFNMPGYNDLCLDAGETYTLPNKTEIVTCGVSGMMRFWSFSSLLFDFTMFTDEKVIEMLSSETYSDGVEVNDHEIFGKLVRDERTGLLTSVESYYLYYALPDTAEGQSAENDYIQTILNINNEWQKNETTKEYRVEAIAQGSFAAEFTRGILIDLPLVPFVFIMMSGFACLYFYRRDRVQSRCLLGFGAVVGVLFSVLTSYGILFICGVPFTSMTQLIPFLIFGIGLDDAFIIVDTYERTDRSKSAEDRIYDAMQESGFSITLTTITSTLAFGIGISSQIPAVRWVCMYASPTIAMVLLYQVTFFVACIIIDEKRVQNKRLDICLCRKAKNYEETKVEFDPTKTWSYKIMERFAGIIFRPKMKVLIVVNFLALAGLCSWSASLFTQQFSYQDVLPDDSYVSSFVNAAKKYQDQEYISPMVVFRDADFSDPDVRDQMEDFVEDLVAMDCVAKEPATFWLRDFNNFTSLEDVSNLTFNDQLRTFLNTGNYWTHRGNMAFSNDGTLLYSRCNIEMNTVDDLVVQTQLRAFSEQWYATLAQPINQGKARPAFFTYESNNYFMWAFYTRCVKELRNSTIVGIVSVSVVAFLFIPHWTAVFFVGPVVCLMYIDILGILQWANMHVNAVTFVSLVMSIGLIVDYIMHILLRYYETPGYRREEKMISAMSTMGVSVFAGGFSTFLGTVPLAFSVTQIFWIIFMSFLVLVSVAMAHTLIFLPVLLSTFGPEDEILSKHDKKSETLPSFT